MAWEFGHVGLLAFELVLPFVIVEVNYILSGRIDINHQV